MSSMSIGISLIVAICLLMVVMWNSHVKLLGIEQYRTTANEANSVFFKEHLCSFESQESLRNIIWSHKSHIDGGIDGSRASVAKLLESGIMKFDIDVVISGDQFLVSHPATMSASSKDEIAQMQTITDFMDQVYQGLVEQNVVSNTPAHHNQNRYFKRKDPYQYNPVVSVEPKFTDDIAILRLIALLEGSPMRHYTALIVSGKQQLHFVLSHVRVLSVSIPFKSYINPNIAAENQFHWHGSASGLSALVSSVTDVPLLKGLPAVLFMPDIKLLGRSVDEALPVDSSAVDLVDWQVLSRFSPIVAWIVDSDVELKSVLSLPIHVNGIISNRPIELLHTLTTWYTDFCHTI